MKKLVIKRCPILSAMVALSFASCAPKRELNPVVPSLEYTKNLKSELGQDGRAVSNTKSGMYADRTPQIQEDNSAKASMHFVNAEANGQAGDSDRDVVSNSRDPQFETVASAFGNSREYSGPLALGDPGVTSSLWRESRGSNDIFRDQRAWQPMDLLTIVVSENAKGSKAANTEVKSKSTVEAAIEQFFAQDDQLALAAPAGQILPSSLVNASTKNEYKGEGTTDREGKLTASISAMVVEVLPSGILRVEGKKIISVNNEEQIMIISGLVRPRDITSANEIVSAKIANMRIDFYGNGVVGEAQYGGWLGRLMHVFWPF